MENIIIHQAESRGGANHGWLQTYHSFSFARYYNPERMNFGVLRVLNDDTIAPGMGFGRHPHDNMEIITIPLEGALEHQDSMGNVQVIRKGDVQVMSAGTGIYHSEYNHSKTQLVKLLQIWIIPDKRNVEPRYDQITLQTQDKENKLVQILSPDPEDAGVWIHQQAWFHIGTFDQGKEVQYTLKKETNGIYAFILEGSFSVNGQKLNQRDGIGISGVQSINIQSTQNQAEILLMEVPLH
jgi:quercetin 2,3-dioxygenase